MKELARYFQLCTRTIVWGVPKGSENKPKTPDADNADEGKLVLSF